MIIRSNANLATLCTIYTHNIQGVTLNNISNNIWPILTGRKRTPLFYRNRDQDHLIIIGVTFAFAQ